NPSESSTVCAARLTMPCRITRALAPLFPILSSAFSFAGSSRPTGGAPDWSTGGFRADLPAGTVTYGDLYAVQPFQNRLVRLFARGEVLQQALEHAVAGDRADAHVSGLEVWYDPRERVGHRVTKVRLTNGQGLENGS